MQNAEQTLLSPPELDLSDEDIQNLMAHAGAVLLDPRVEPVARQLKQLIDRYATSPLALPIALAMMAAANGSTRSIPGLTTPLTDIQARVIEITLARQLARETPPTLH